MWNAIVRLSTGKTAPDPHSIITLSGQSKVDSTISNYLETFKEQDVGRDERKTSERKEGYQSLIRSYYDLVTDFYEYGWGESFHFGTRYNFESFDESIRRHEYYLASRLGLKSGMKVLDCGCGVGGPMRNISRFSGCSVTGVTINQYQVARTNALNLKYGLSSTCKAELGDFMNLGDERKAQFDAAYGIEATCHAPDRTKCFTEVFQALKPGAYFAVYEWVMTPLYDPNDTFHRLVKHEIEKGDSLPELTSAESVLQSVKDAGFEILESRDMAVEANKSTQTIPWYSTLQGGLKLSQFKHTSLGRFVTHVMVTILETLRIAPRGTTKTHHMLSQAAKYLAIGGEKEIFTPMFFVLARKPL